MTTMEPPETMSASPDTTDAVTSLFVLLVQGITAKPVRLPEVSLHMKMETFNLLREFAAELPGTTPAERALKRITGTTP